MYKERKKEKKHAHTTVQQCLINVAIIIMQKNIYLFKVVSKNCSFVTLPTRLFPEMRSERKLRQN